MVLDGELLCANSGWSYALVYDAFDRHVLLKKVTRFNPVVASLTLIEVRVAVPVARTVSTCHMIYVTMTLLKPT